MFRLVHVTIKGTSKLTRRQLRDKLLQDGLSEDEADVVIANAIVSTANSIAAHDLAFSSMRGIFPFISASTKEETADDKARDYMNQMNIIINLYNEYDKKHTGKVTDLDLLTRFQAMGFPTVASQLAAKLMADENGVISIPAFAKAIKCRIIPLREADSLLARPELYISRVTQVYDDKGLQDPAAFKTWLTSEFGFEPDVALSLLRFVDPAKTNVVDRELFLKAKNSTRK